MRIKTGIFLFGLLIFITSCAQKKNGEKKPSLVSNLIEITDNEDKGIKEILEYYGGQCEYSIGNSISTKKGKSKYFVLEVSNSVTIDSYYQIAPMPASNIAYLFYKNLKEEKVKYKEIHTVLRFTDGEEMTFKYSPEELEVVKNRMVTVEKIINLIKLKDFEGIKPFLNSNSVVKYDKNELVKNLEKLDPSLGNVKGFLPYGFGFTDSGNGQKFLRIMGGVIRDSQIHEFNANFDLNAPIEEVILIGYKL